MTTTDIQVSTQTLCFAAPLLPDMTGHDREEMLSCGSGPRHHDYADSRQRHGITREAVWIQSTPDGDVAVVLLESANLEAALLGIAMSEEPFDVWFREHLTAVHGIDLSQGMFLPENVLDYRSGS